MDLRAIIREVAAESSAADPATLTKEVARRIGRRDIAAALDQALPYAVRELLHAASGSSTDLPGSQSGSDAQTGSAAGQPARSAKVASIRETWRRRLRDRVSVGPDASDWKFLSECTAADLDYAAELRDRMAAANAARAQQFRDLANAVREYEVETVADLPDLATRLGDAA